MQEGIYGLPEWPIALHLQSWRKAHGRKKIRAGEILILPSSQHFAAQVFTVKDVFFRFPKASSKRKVHITWSSTCCICQAPYEFYKLKHARSLMRTCPQHRGLKPKHTRPKPYRAPYKPESPLRDLLLACMADCACTSPTIDLTAYIDYCIDHMEPPEGRDTRRQSVIASLRRMESRGAMPQGVALSGNMLNFASW